MSNLGRRPRTMAGDEEALQQGPRKRPVTTDPLVHKGRHFGRTVFAFANIKPLIMNGLIRLAEDNPPDSLTAKERQEDIVFRALLRMCHGLEDRLLDGSEGVVTEIADLLQRGAHGSRADDTKGMKGPILEWISAKDPLVPPLHRRNKCDRGFNHNQTGVLLCPTGLDWDDSVTREKLRSGQLQVRGDQWPAFLYPSYDPENPWNGLLRGPLLVTAYKHVFTSPSSVDFDDGRATRSGNARIHGMTSVTSASIAYIATQVRFALTSASIFSRTDKVTDSETFYTSIYDLLADPLETKEVQELLAWWNKRIFPHESCMAIVQPIEGSALDRIRQKRAEKLAEASEGSN